MNENRGQTTLVWIGDHSLKMYRVSDEAVLRQFKHQIILYDRRVSDPENDCSEEPITYVKEFYPQVDPKYSLEELNTPMHALLGERIREMKENEREILFIGDTAELLCQAVVDIGFGFDFKSDAEPVQSEPFEVVALVESDTGKCHLNLTQFDALFLKEQMPFEEEMEEAIHSREIGLNGFRNAYRCMEIRGEVNDFLWHYNENARNVDQKVAYIKTS